MENINFLKKNAIKILNTPLKISQKVLNNNPTEITNYLNNHF